MRFSYFELNQANESITYAKNATPHNIENIAVILSIIEKAI